LLALNTLDTGDHRYPWYQGLLARLERVTQALLAASS
ncbi:MAG: hypothetical protein ACI90G_002311, partial [Urechidicola sp.]